MFCRFVFAQVSRQVHIPVSYSKGQWIPEGDKWIRFTKSDWTDDEKQEMPIWLKIESLKSDRDKLEPYYIYCEKEAQKRPDDVRAQYAWAATFIAMTKYIKFTGPQWNAVAASLSRFEKPNNYYMARAKYSIYSWSNKDSKYLSDFCKIGKRILERDPQNKNLKFKLIQQMSYCKDEKINKESILWAEDFAKENPDWHAANGLAGCAFFFAWERLKNEKYAIKSYFYLNKSINKKEYAPWNRDAILYCKT